METRTSPIVKNGVIVLFLIIFFPIAFILLFIRHISHRNYTHLKVEDCRFSSKLLFVIFCIFSVAFAFALIGSSGDPAAQKQNISVYIWIAVLFLLPSIVLKIRGAKHATSIAERQGRYTSLIYEQRVTNISQAANIVGKRSEVVAQELLWMKHLRKLPDVTVYPESDQIVLYVPAQQEVQEELGELAGLAAALNNLTGNKEASTLHPKVVNCYGCGAKMQLQPGESKPCEYCRSTLVYA